MYFWRKLNIHQKEKKKKRKENKKGKEHQSKWKREKSKIERKNKFFRITKHQNHVWSCCKEQSGRKIMTTWSRHERIGSNRLLSH